MKKRIRLFIGFLFILFVGVDTNASITPVGDQGFYGQYGGYYPCYWCAEFDYVIGRDAISDTLLDDINYVLNELNCSSTLEYEGKYVSVDGLSDVDFYCQIFTSDGKAKKIDYYVEGKLLYEAVAQSDNLLKATLNEPIDLNYYAGSKNKLFKLPKSDNHYSCTYDFSNSPSAETRFGKFVQTFLFGYKVFENENYNNQDLYFIVDSCNPLTERDIISSLDVSDNICGVTHESNIEIIDSEYIISDNYVTPGTYNMKIKAWDDNGNITYQSCKVISADVTAPVILGSGTMPASANKLLSKEEIFSFFNAYDEYSSVSFEIVKDDYTKNYMKSGNYDFSVIVKDEAGNKKEGSITINVKDEIPPTITYEDLYIPADIEMTEAEIKSHIHIYDDVDGVITVFDIVDVDGYFETPHKQGEYQFEVYFKDEAGNENSDMISIYVVDNIGPEIKAPTYTVLLNKGENVTREQILNILKSSGQITSMENTIINSLYFSTLNPEGEYELEVISDGEVFYDIIKFVDRNNTSSKIDDDFYAIPVKGKNNNTYYIVLGISAGVIIILATLGVIIYKKKH